MAEDPANSMSNSLLILKSTQMTLLSAEQFLRTRGWVIYSTVGLTEAVKFLFEKKINYFLICANHPQKKVKDFPKLLSQFRQLKVITYTDIASTLNMAHLQEMGIPYQILPPVSGPAIERIAFRIEKDLLQPKDQNKGPFFSDLSDIQKITSDRKYGQESLNRYFDSDTEDAAIFLESTDRDTKLKFKSTSDTTSDRSTDSNTNSASNSSESATESATESFFEYEERKKREEAGQIKDPQFSNSMKPLIQDSNNKKIEEFAFRRNKSNSENLKTALSGKIETKNVKYIRKSKTLEQGTRHAIDNSVKHSDAPIQVQKLSKAQNCICLAVEAETFSGFLVAAMGRNRSFDENLLSNIQSKLFDFLRVEGLIIDETKPLEIKVRSVDFENWAIEKAEFLKKSVHDGNEVAMAFFPTEKTAPNLGESKSADMLSIDIDDLETDHPLTYDVYIHMPANDKYILYTPKGGMFLDIQKNRLKAKGINKMHSKKDDVNAIKKYHIENELNHSIEEFQTNQSNDLKKSNG